MKKIKSFIGKAIAFTAATVMLVSGLPATALAESDSQSVTSDWFLLYKTDEPTPADSDNYSWRLRASITVENGILTTVSLKCRGLGNVVAVPEMEIPYAEPICTSMKANIEDAEIDATNPNAVDAVDIVSGATHTSYRAKLAVKTALQTWNVNKANVQSVIDEMSAIGSTYTKEQVSAARADYEALSDELKAYVPVASYAKLIAAEEDIVAHTIAAPKAAIGLVYNGKAQTGVAAGTGYTVTGGSATNAGTYTATATLLSNYTWSDGTTAPKAVKFTVAKASQAITVAKAAKSAKKGKTTSAIKVTGAKTAKVFKKAGGSKFLTLTKAGEIKISKKAVKGKTYKIKVKIYAKANSNYNASVAKTVTIKVKVK